MSADAMKTGRAVEISGTFSPNPGGGLKTFTAAMLCVLPWYLFLSIWNYPRIPTDHAAHLFRQISAWTPSLMADSPTFLMQLVGGLWMKLCPVGHPWLWWGTLGGCLLWATMAGVVAVTVRILFACSVSVAVGATQLAFLAMPFSNIDLVIQYYTFPSLLLSIYFLQMLCIQQGNRQWTMLVGLGLLNAAILCARTPLLFVIGAPPLLVLLNWLFSRGKFSISWSMAAAWLAGLAIGIAGFVLFKRWWIPTPEYNSALGDTTLLADTLQRILIWLEGWSHRFGIGGILLMLLMGCGLLAGRSRRLAMATGITLGLGVLLFVAVAPVVLTIAWPKANMQILVVHFRFLWSSIPFAVLLYLLTADHLLPENRRPFTGAQKAWLATVCLVLSGMPIGADMDTGFSRMISAACGVTAVVLVMGWRYARENTVHRWLFGWMAIPLTMVLFNLVAGFSVFDSGQKFFSIPELRWTRAPAETVDRIESDLAMLREFIHPGDGVYDVGLDSPWYIWLLDAHQAPGRRDIHKTTEHKKWMRINAFIAHKDHLPEYAILDKNLITITEPGLFNPGHLWVRDHVLYPGYEMIADGHDVQLWRKRPDFDPDTVDLSGRLVPETKPETENEPTPASFHEK